MEERYLIDTSAVIKYINGTLPLSGLHFLDQVVDNETIVSLITEIELRVWEPKNALDIEIYDAFIKGCLVLGLTATLLTKQSRSEKSTD